MKVNIEFQPIGRRGECLAGSTILECARNLGVEIVSICGGQGNCGHCIVQLLKGQASEPDDTELEVLGEKAVAEGYRLACRASVAGDCLVRIPPQSMSTLQRTQIEGEDIPLELEPAVKNYPIKLSPPSFTDLQADAERLKEALANQGVAIATVDTNILREISPRLRDFKWQAQVAVCRGEVTGLLPVSSSPLGLAVDLGTSKIAVYLVDLTSGQTVGKKGIVNPQIPYGEDIISRLAMTVSSPEKAAMLQGLIVDAINEAATEMCAGISSNPSCIVDSVFVANTAMHHLFLGLPVRQLAAAPYVPAVSSALDIKASSIGLGFASGAYAHVLPNIAGYVGADHVAMILSTGINKAKGVALALDIGTNTEICLANHGSLTSLSCASGPAFEGAHIKSGMRAADGAIEHLQIHGDRIEYQTIGGVKPVGLCGSAILDTLAQLLRAGVIDASGRMLDHPRVREVNGVREFVLVEGENNYPDITFTQKDVREIQLAKGAIRTGIQVLLEANRLKEESVDEVIIAGAFGTYIDIASAIAIGMLPDIPMERFRQVGNAAGIGAKMALISQSRRLETQEIARSVQYIELASEAGFQEIFNEAIKLESGR